MDGVSAIGGLGNRGFQSIMCGDDFGVDGLTTPVALICKYFIMLQCIRLLFLTARKQPFIVGVYTDTTTAHPGGTGFNLDYTQVIVACVRNKSSSLPFRFPAKLDLKKKKKQKL